MEMLQPNQYFDMIKSKKNKVTDKELQRYYDNCLVLLNKYKQTNQNKAAKKLIFHLESIEKEREIVFENISVIKRLPRSGEINLDQRKWT